MNGTLLRGDCRMILPTLDADSVQCVVTSPPYLGLRDYGVDGQIGLESVPDCLGWATGNPCGHCFVCELVGVFREVRRVLRPDGTCWVNLGDSYAGSGRGGRPGGGASTLQGGGETQARAPRARVDRADVSASQREHAARGATTRQARRQGLKEKDLMGMPWRVALALQADGWYLRQDVIWHKPNPMPESIRDRCTKAHEYLFLLAKSERYYFDQDAIREPASPGTHARQAANGGKHPAGWESGTGRNHRSTKGRFSPPEPKANGVGWGYADGDKAKPRTRAEPHTVWNGERHVVLEDADSPKPRTAHVVDAEVSARMGRGPGWRTAQVKANGTMNAALQGMPETRNKRSVWTIPTQAFSEAHFATYPEALAHPCIAAGSRPGDLVLDPFMGAGTTAVVCERLGRRWIGCELNPEYADLSLDRVRSVQPGLGLA